MIYIIATAYYAIPFNISGALPDDFSRDPDDIVVWTAQVRPAQLFSMNGPAYDQRTQLLFYRSDVSSARSLIDGMPSIFEGRSTPPRGTFFVLTVQEHVQYESCVRFRLSRRRMERMRAERWRMVAYRNDSGEEGECP